MAREVFRAAAEKLMGVLVIPGGIRGKAPEHLPVSSSARMPFSASPSVSAMTSGEEAAGDREPIPRVVFHGVPTLEEAKEATSKLILGIENIYPSCSSNSQVEKATASVTGEITTEPAVPTIVNTAFRLLRESPLVQNVVASLACDPKMWKAACENQQLQEILDWKRSRWASSRLVTGAEYAESTEDPSNDASSKRGIGFEDLLKTIKDMVDMIENVSDFIKNLFRYERAKPSANGDHGAPGASAKHVMEASLFTSEGAKSSTNGDHGDPGASAEDDIKASLFTSLLGLAIMAIMLICLKRG